MSLVQISHLTFSYDGGLETVFDDVSLSFDTTWRLGLIGRNGRGKTTLLRLLAGAMPYRGRIDAPVCFSYFPYEADTQGRTAREVAEAIQQTPSQAVPSQAVPSQAVPPQAIEPWRLSRELSLLEFDEGALERPFETLSMGERAKLQLAALFLREDRFLLIDEPTNHLDLHAREVTGRYLRGKEGFILVSHDRAFLDACVDHVLSIQKSGLVLQRGNFSTWQENERLRETHERAENERLAKDIRRLDEASRRASGWSDRTEKSKIGTHAADRGFIGHKAAKMMKRAKSIQQRRESAAEGKASLLRDIESAEPLAVSPLVHHASCLARLENVCLSYQNRTVCGPLRLDIKPGTRTAVLGRNGSGKSSLLKLLAGESVAYTGQLWMASGLHVSYVPQDATFLSGDVRRYARECGVDESLMLTILRKLDFSRLQFEADMKGYSAGQKKKVLLARSLSERAHLYLWDEPLNYVDVLSRMQLEELIRNSGMTLVYVEHDRAFVDATADEQLCL